MCTIALKANVPKASYHQCVMYIWPLISTTGTVIHAVMKIRQHIVKHNGEILLIVIASSNEFHSALAIL